MSIADLADGHDIHDIEEAVKVDTGFHDIIYKASRNEKLVQFITHLREADEAISCHFACIAWTHEDGIRRT